jgi:glutamate 5-kinase
VITNGSEPDVLKRLVDGESLGTRITSIVDKLESRKRFMLAGAVSRAGIRIDAGAVKALCAGGSLLPVGISEAYGRFERGDIVKVKDPAGKECAIGLVNYSSEDVDRIKGQRSTGIETILGYAYGDEVIHHDNMTLLG